MIVFGDAEAAVIAILSAALDPVAVAPDLNGWSFPQPWVRVQRLGGVPTPWQGTDNPIVEIAAYGADKGSALDLAGAARAAVFAGRGYVGNGLLLYDVAEDNGLAWVRDEMNPTAPRYLLTFALVTKPA